MDKRKRAVIIGMALGDGYVQVRTRYNGNSPYQSRTMRVLHGPQQKAYCEYKAKRLGWALGGRQVNVTKVKNGPGGKYDAYQFSVSHPYFGQVRRWLYPNGQKRFTAKVLDMLNNEALAIWYMDDGSARKNTNSSGFVSSVATDIATMCSEQEAHEIAAWFHDTHRIEWKVRRKKNAPDHSAFFIQCNTAGSHTFASLVTEHIPDCMKYKLSHVALANSHERQTPTGNCLECGDSIYDNRRKSLCVRCYTQQIRAIG